MSDDIYKRMAASMFGGGKRKPAEQSPTSNPAKKLTVAPTPEATTQRSPSPATDPVPPAKKVRVPPMFLDYVQDWPRHAKKIQALVGEHQATCIGKQIKLKLTTVEDFRKVQRYLTGENLAFHTFAFKDGRSLKVVISGLPGSMDPMDIIDELIDLGFEVQEVFRLRALRGLTNRWVVTLGPDGDSEKRASEIYSLNSLCYLKISVAAFKKRPGPTQCFRCQGFGHGSIYCGRPLKCVRCGEEHRVKDCPKPSGEIGKCCNCGGQHNASYRGCPAYKKKAAGRPDKRPAQPTSQRELPEETQAAQEQPEAVAEEEVLGDGFLKVKRRKRAPRNPANRNPRQPKPADKPTEDKPREAAGPQPITAPETPRVRQNFWQPKAKPAATEAEQQPLQREEEGAPALLREVLQQMTSLLTTLSQLIPLLTSKMG